MIGMPLAFRPVVVIPSLAIHGLCFVGLLVYFLSPPHFIIAFLLLSVLGFEAAVGVWLCFGLRTEITEEQIQQRILWHEATICWAQPGVRIRRGIIFQTLRAPGPLFVILPTRFSGLTQSRSYNLMDEKLRHVRTAANKPGGGTKPSSS